MKGRTRMTSESARLVPVKHRGVTMRGSTTIFHLHRLLWSSCLRVPILASEGILNACSIRVTPKTMARTSTRNSTRELLLIQIKKGVASAPRYQHVAFFNPYPFRILLNRLMERLPHKGLHISRYASLKSPADFLLSLSHHCYIIRIRRYQVWQ